MTSTQRPEKVVYQDYIARIRYSNALPPPPNPPKLLNIPGTGLDGEQYTSAGYASRMAREYPLNIEADAELGMPIDLIGIPGVFDGDERAILARPGPITLHPADRALLKPLTALGKPSATSGSVSFLRRTEYTASQSSQHFTSSTSKDLLRLRNDNKRRKPSVNREDPINIMRNIVKGFDLAYPRDAYKGEDNTTNLRGAQISDAEITAWSQPKHPTKPTLELLDSYPVLPDLEAIPTTGFYLVMKFINNPLPATGVYDERLDTAFLRPVSDPQAMAAFEHRRAEWDPNSSKTEPIPEYDYDFYLPNDIHAVRGIKRKFDVNDPDHADADLYADDLGDGQRAFKYSRLRTYETYNQHGDPRNFYNDTIALSLHDADTDVGVTPDAHKRLPKGAYFYPIVQRTALRPKRAVKLGFTHPGDDQRIDELNVTIADPDDAVQSSQIDKRALLDPAVTAPAEDAA